MSDKAFGVNARLLDSLRLEDPLIDIDRLVRAKDSTELLIVIYPEVKRIREKYKKRAVCGCNIDSLRYDLNNLCEQILFCFEYNGCAMRPALPCATYLPYRVRETIDATMRLIDIATDLLPVSLDKLILDLTHDPNPCTKADTKPMKKE